VITAGFSEAGDGSVTTDRDLVNIAHHYGMRLLGPNCFGVIAPAVGLDATFSSVPAIPGDIAFGSQSGGIGLAVLAEAVERGIGLSSFVSLGNRADVSSNDLMCAWVDDPATKVIMLYLESIGNPRHFLRIARHVAMRKPVIVLKAGRSTSGRRGAASHTASLASDDAAVDALFGAAGVIRVGSLEEMLDVAQLLSHQGAPAGPRLALIGNAGGPLILAADAAEASGLQVPTLSDGLRARILERVPRAAATSNPVDLLATVTADDVADVVGMVAASGEVDGVVIASVGVRPHEDTNLDNALNGAPEDSGQTPLPTARPVPVAISIAGIPARLSKRAVFRYSESAVRAMGRAHSWSAWRAQVRAKQATELTAGQTGAATDTDWLAVRRLVRAEAVANTNGDNWLSPEACERIMRVAGVRLVRSAFATSAQQAVDLAPALLGESGTLVLKAVVPGLLHKTEAGGVLLDIPLVGVSPAFKVFAERFPNLTGVLIQEQVATGPELLVGARQDPSAGPLVVVAAGGVEAELLRDRVLRAAPLSHSEATEMVLSLGTARRLTGFRGRPAVNLDEVAHTVSVVSHLVALVPELAEFEINPLVANASGAVAVDMRIRTDIGANSVIPLRGQ
jgi:acyl-CoA synthetase (NDP forming)